MTNIKRVKKPLFNFSILVLLILLNLYLLSHLVKLDNNHSISKIPPQTEEIAQIKKVNNIDQQVKFYKKLIERVGPEQAQEELFHSGLPFDGQTHLLNHTVGDYLFDKYGNEGLTHCKDYFLSSCYHGFVLRAIGANGLDGLDPVLEICSQKGYYVMVQCTHAIGHGLLVWFDYPNLIKALQSCDEIGAKRSDVPLFSCYDGIFMENIWGIHNGKPSPERWIKEGDLIYPCNDVRIDEKYINACWAEQPTIIYQQTQGNIPKVSDECLKLKNPTYQTTCFDSLARQINPIANGDVDKLFHLCSLVAKQWQDSCLFSNVASFYSIGDKKIPFEICSRLSNSTQQTCYEMLAGIISVNTNSAEERKELCNKIPNVAQRSQCSL